MVVKLVKQKFNNESSYKIHPLKPCCDFISKIDILGMNNEYINSDFECLDENGCEENVPHFCLDCSYTVYDWEDEIEIDNYVPIKYCPFCGEPIIIITISEEDVSGKYNNIKKKMKELRDKICKTDSIKKRDALEEELQECNTAINYILGFAEYNEEILKKY